MSKARKFLWKVKSVILYLSHDVNDFVYCETCGRWVRSKYDHTCYDLRELTTLIEDGRKYNKLVSGIQALVQMWRVNAESRVPAEYSDRGLSDKYLRGDSEAAGWGECADDLQGLLEREDLT